MTHPTMAPANLAQAGPDPVSIPVIPVRELLPWTIFGGLFLLLALYFVGVEGDAHVHEFMHDGRHLLGFPCH